MVRDDWLRPPPSFWPSSRPAQRLRIHLQSSPRFNSTASSIRSSPTTSPMRSRRGPFFGEKLSIFDRFSPNKESVGMNRPRSRADSLLIAFVAILVALSFGRWGFESPSEPSPDRERPPADSTAEDKRCPSGHPIRGYDDTFMYYPPTHPSLLELPPPDRCFPSQRAASDSGFSPAATPVTAERVHQEYLIPAEPALRRQCRVAAERLGFRVPCPRLVPITPIHPAGREEVECDRGFLSTKACTYRATFLLEGRSFVFRATPTATR